MTTIKKYEGIQYIHHNTGKVNDALTIEAPLQICINGNPFLVTMRTPGNDVELVRGLLFTEDVYRSNEPVEMEISQNDSNIETIANLLVNEQELSEGYRSGRNLLSVSSCGICGKTELDLNTTFSALKKETMFSAASLQDMFDSMKAAQKTFQESGGSHAAAAFTISGESLSVMEDIGRHNAVDKVIGDLIISQTLKKATFLLVSGRVSYEIVSKVFAAKIPVLASVSAPSTLAIDFAKELGITLISFCRGDKATCYAHPQRIT